jgi:hypothetical protein
MDHVKPAQADQERGKAGLGRKAAFYSSKKIRALLGGTHSGYGGKQYGSNHGYSTYPQHDSQYVEHPGKGKLIHHGISLTILFGRHAGERQYSASFDSGSSVEFTAELNKHGFTASQT